MYLPWNLIKDDLILPSADEIIPITQLFPKLLIPIKEFVTRDVDGRAFFKKEQKRTFTLSTSDELSINELNHICDFFQVTQTNMVSKSFGIYMFRGDKIAFNIHIFDIEPGDIQTLDYNWNEISVQLKIHYPK